MIREYSKDDTDQIVSIWKAASAVAHPFLPDDFIAKETDALRNVYLAFAETWVTERDGVVVGFVSLVEDELAGLFLEPSLHGQGLGRAMVDFAVARKGPLRVEVFERNAIGRRFYTACGFNETERVSHDATGETLLKLAMPGA